MYLRDATYEEVRVNLCCFIPNKDEHWQAVIENNGEEIEREGVFVLTRSNFLNYWENRYLF